MKKYISPGEIFDILMMILITVVSVMSVIGIFSFFNIFISIITSILIILFSIPAYTIAYEEYIENKYRRIQDNREAREDKPVRKTTKKS